MFSQLLLSALPATLLLFIASASPASAAAIQPRQGPGRVHDWITIDPNGHPITITPTVTTTNGVLTTISPPPYALTGSVFTVTATNGALTTSTGNPPPPQASNTKGYGGVFSVCNNNPGPDGPFCQPRRGSTLYVETTYYITWDTSFFTDPDTPIGIVGYDVSNTGNMDAAPAFSVTNIRGGTGWAYWTPNSRDLEEKSSNNMTLIMMYNDPLTDEQKNVTGPVFTIVPPLDDPNSGSSPNLLPIILPVILITLAIVAVMLYLCYRRRSRRAAAAAAAAAKYNATVAGPKVRTDRMSVRKSAAGIRLEPTSPLESPPPESGRNVFQEEELIDEKRSRRT